MIFTGTQLSLKRNIYTQNNNFGLILNCFVDDPEKAYHFGMSGESGAFDIIFQSGKVMLGDMFVHSYNQNFEFSLECQFTSTGYNIIKDGNPLIYGGIKPSGDFNYVYFSREDDSIQATFNVSVSGQNYPSAQIDQNAYLLTNSQNAVTGFYRNYGSYPIEIFDSESSLIQGLDFGKIAGSVPPLSDLPFSFTGGFDSYDFTQPILITFSTNYGYPDTIFTIIDARSLDHFVFLGDIPSYSFNNDNQLNRNLFYTNYSGGFVSDSFPTSLTFSLEYVTGSGSFSNISNIIPYSSILYGNLFQSGTLTGQKIIPTGINNLTGNYILNLNQFSWATGLVTGYFHGFGTGLASGTGYTGLAYGEFTGTVTATIQDGSGTFLYNSNGQGSGFNAVSVDYQSYINATGNLTVSGLQKGDFFYIGIESVPIIKGVQFSNETGLVYYLSGALQHKVDSYTTDGIIYLNSRISGSNGNDIFVRVNHCDFGSSSYTPYLSGGENIGSTGLNVIAISPFYGPVVQTITGSGDYALNVNGSALATFYYTKTFTGYWEIFTGINSKSLVPLKVSGGFDSTTISGSGLFAPNSFVNFQVNHISDGISSDSARLIISGADILNPIVQVLTN